MMGHVFANISNTNAYKLAITLDIIYLGII